MPLKKTDEGFEYGADGDHVWNKQSKSNPFDQEVVIRDTNNRPLRWNEKIGDYEVDIEKWIQETNS